MSGGYEPTVGGLFKSWFQVDHDDRTALYRVYDASDRLLYVGIADDVDARFHGHAQGAEWLEHAARAHIELYPDRKSAAAAELDAIRSEDPVFNGSGRPAFRREQMLCAYPDGDPESVTPAQAHAAAGERYRRQRGPMSMEEANRRWNARHARVRLLLCECSVTWAASSGQTSGPAQPLRSPAMPSPDTRLPTASGLGARQ